MPAMNDPYHTDIDIDDIDIDVIDVIDDNDENDDILLQLHNNNHNHDQVPTYRPNEELHDHPMDVDDPVSHMDSTTTISSSSNQRIFCQSMRIMSGSGSSGGMIMYMDGFHWTTYSYYHHHHHHHHDLQQQQPQQQQSNTRQEQILPCLNILSPSYTIQTITQFYMVCVLVFVLAIGTEGMTKLRYLYIRHWITTTTTTTTTTTRRHCSRNHHYNHTRVPRHPRRTCCCSHSNHNNNNTQRIQYGYRKCMIPILHGVQACMGYLLMLMVMTYSIELFICVIFGLMVGYYIFFVASSCFTDHETNRNDDDEYDADQNNHIHPNDGTTTNTTTSTGARTTNMDDSVIAATTLRPSERDPLLHQRQQQRQRDLLLLTTVSSSNPCCDFLQSPAVVNEQ